MITQQIITYLHKTTVKSTDKINSKITVKSTTVKSTVKSTVKTVKSNNSKINRYKTQ